MVSKTEIVSAAFSYLGKNGVSDIDPESAEPIVITASQQYELLLSNTLQRHPWRFATFTRTLNKLVDEPPVEQFKNAFQLPADFLNLERTNRITRFRIYEDKIYSNEDTLQIDYRAKLDESKFPAYFTLYLEYRLAADMAMPITQQITIKKDWDVSAKQQLLIAQYQNSQQQTNDVIVNDPVLAFHIGSSNFGTRF